MRLAEPVPSYAPRRFCCFCRKLSATVNSFSAGILECWRLGERQNSEMTTCSGRHRQIGDINAAISSERALENSMIIDIRIDQLLE